MRIASVAQPSAGRPQRSEPVIVFAVGPETFGISAGAVLEIGSTDGLAGTASAFSHPEVPKVRHTLQRGGRTYFVINACTHFHLPPSRPALLLLLNESRAALLVDRIECMTEITRLIELPRAFSGEERLWYRGLALQGDRVLPIVKAASFLTPQEIELLDAAIASERSGDPRVEVTA
jgi:chemotaxis signal transduction protein